MDPIDQKELTMSNCQSIRDQILGRTLLWHGTSLEHAEAISREGFRPSPRQSQHNFRQATWFYHSTTFTEEVPDEGTHFIAAVDLSDYERGTDYIHEMDDTIVFLVPLPAHLIVARVDSPRGPLTDALSGLWSCDLVGELAIWSCDASVPWRERQSVSEMLFSLSPRTYATSGVASHLLASEAELAWTTATKLEDGLRNAAPRFLQELLRLYHRVFLTPRLGRAAMISAVKCLSPRQILAAADDREVPGTSGPEQQMVADFLSTVLPRLPASECIRGAIDMASIRRLPDSEHALDEVSDWCVRRASLEGNDVLEEVAIHYLMFAGDNFPTRHKVGIALDIATRMLESTGLDYFERLNALANTDSHIVTAGLLHAFGALREERGIPFIAKLLTDNRKMVRVSAINALGKIGSSAALEALNAVANDKRKVVREAVERAMAIQEGR